MWWALLSAALAIPPAYLGPDGPAWLGPLPPTPAEPLSGTPWLDLVVVVAPLTGELYLQERDNAEVLRVWSGREWSVAGAPLSETWPAREDVAYRLSSGGRLIAVGGVGGERRFRYDGEGNLIEASWPDGARLRVRYDEAGRVTEVTGPWLSRWRLEWDTDRLRAVDDLGRPTTFRRHASGLVEVQDAMGRVARAWYDVQGALVGWEDPRGLQGRIQREGDREVIQAGDGRVWTLMRDEAGEIVRLEAPGGVLWRWDRVMPGGPVRAQIDPTGRVMRWDRDAQGRVVATSMGGAVTRYERDERGRVITITDPGGASTRLTRDAQGRVVAITDAVGGRVSIERYDGGLPRVIEDRTGGRWTVGLDLLGRPDLLTDPTGRTIALQRGAGGRLSGVRDLRFGVTRLERGPTGVLNRITDPDGVHQGFVRDAVGRVAQVQLPDGQTLRLDRDILGDVVAVVYGDQRLEIARDTAGRPLRVGAALSWRWAPEGYIEYARLGALSLDLRRDLAGRLEALAAGGWWLQIGRDLAGRPQAWEGTDGAIQVRRDPSGRLMAEESAEHSVVLARDLRGLVERASEGGRVWRWLRDAAGRVLRRTAPGELLLGVDRDEAGRVALLRLANGTLLRRRWVEALLVERLELPDGTLRVEQLTQLDALGRVRWLQVVGGDRREIFYAPDGSVAMVQMADGETAWSWDPEILKGPAGVTILLDDQGRMLEARPPDRLRAWGVGEGLLSAFWGEDGRLEGVAGDLGSVRIAHDELGRLRHLETLEGQTWTLRYDARGRLTTVVQAERPSETAAVHRQDLLWSPEAFSGWWRGDRGGEGLLATGVSLERSHLFSAEGVWLQSEGEGGLWTRDRLQLWQPASSAPITPMGLPLLRHSPEAAPALSLTDDGGVALFPGGPILFGGVGIEPLSGQRTDGVQPWPWAVRTPRPEVRLLALDPSPWSPRSVWGDPLTLLVALGALAPVEAYPDGWSPTSPERAAADRAVDWLPPALEAEPVPLSVRPDALPLQEDPITLRLLWALLPGGAPLAPEMLWECLLLEEREPMDLPPGVLLRGVLSEEG